MNFYAIVQHAHSGMRWLVLLFLVLAILKGVMNWRQSAPYPGRDGTVLLGLIFTHVQLLLGLILYFVSPYVRFEGDIMGDELIRFYTVEHITGMLVAVALITIGYARAKRQAGDQGGWRSVWVFYLLGLALMLVMIPWPGRDLNGNWF